jgi:hypothetical protein
MILPNQNVTGLKTAHELPKSIQQSTASASMADRPKLQMVVMAK